MGEAATEGRAGVWAGLAGAPCCVSRAAGGLPGEGCAWSGPGAPPGARVLCPGLTWAFLPPSLPPPEACVAGPRGPESQWDCPSR